MVQEDKIGVAERIKGRDRVRLKGNNESESLRLPELASNRQKTVFHLFLFFPTFFPKKLLLSARAGLTYRPAVRPYLQAGRDRGRPLARP